MPRVDLDRGRPAGGAGLQRRSRTAHDHRRRSAIVGDPMMTAPQFLRQLGLSAGRAIRARSADRAHRQLCRRAPQPRLLPGARHARRQFRGRRPRRQPDADGRGRAATSASCSSAIRCRAMHATTLVPIEREGSADEDLLEDSSNRIEVLLRGQGYRDARAPHTRQESDGELRITFDVQRGIAVSRRTASSIAGAASLRLPDLRVQPADASGGAVRRRESRCRRLGASKAPIAGAGLPRPGCRPIPGCCPPTAGGTQIPVAVSILITEGVRTMVGTVRIEGNASVPEGDLRPLLSLQPGTPYLDAQLRRDTDAIELAVRQSRLPIGDGAGPAQLRRRSLAGRSRLRRQRGRRASSSITY